MKYVTLPVSLNIYRVNYSGQIHIEDSHITAEILHLIFILCYLGTQF